MGDILKQLRDLPEERRKAPLTLDSVDLSQGQARLLEANGVLFRDNDQYWIPEIYRYGLGFGSSKVGRPPVVSIRNRIRSPAPPRVTMRRRERAADRPLARQ